MHSRQSHRRFFSSDPLFCDTYMIIVLIMLIVLTVLNVILVLKMLACLTCLKTEPNAGHLPSRVHDQQAPSYQHNQRICKFADVVVVDRGLPVASRVSLAAERMARSSSKSRWIAFNLEGWTLSKGRRSSVLTSSGCPWRRVVLTWREDAWLTRQRDLGWRG